MLIVKCAKGNGQKLQANQQVKRIGQYMYKHLDGAFKFKSTGNTFDVYCTLLYQLPYLQRIPGKGKEYNDVHEMTLNINITTYQNKVRINIIEMTPEERTIGFDLFYPEELEDLQMAYKQIMARLHKRIAKAYKEYEFLY